jgi:crotonobetainyl-CoA:carnitine CoA-transferase CaiB-like acyl-CoA transferase
MEPLSGVVVVEFATTIAGPYCGRMLADMGASVIKVEAPEGDVMRSRPPLRQGASSSFGQLNAGKKSVVLDLKSAEDRAVARALALQADVLVENNRPGVMARLGLGYDDLKKEAPRLIYCSVSGYGQTGPLAGKPAYAPVVHADSGFDLAHLAYQEGRARPDYCGIFHADVMAGLHAFSAVTTALYAREKTGLGQHVDVSMMEAMLGLTLNEVQGAQFTLPKPGRPLFGPLEVKDGYLVVAIVNEKSFRNFVTAAGKPEFVTDPRFADYTQRRLNWAILMDEVEAWSRSLTREECMAVFTHHDVPASAYRTVTEALADPQIAHRGALAPVQDAAGVFHVVNPPFRFSNAPSGVKGFSAALGEHTQEVLSALRAKD